MNNYANMNYFAPNNYDYLNQLQNMQKQNTFQPNQQAGKPIGQQMMPHTGQKMPMKQPMPVQDATLKQKLSTQAGDNMNFNKCNYDQQVDPNNLYDVYNGFIRGNMFPDLYNQYKINKPFDIEPMNEQAELLTYIDAYSFAAHDLNLYLDNNPNDRDMIDLFNSFTDEANKVRRDYEKKYGPLFVDASNTFPWAWNNSPWPWENK